MAPASIRWKATVRTPDGQTDERTIAAPDRASATAIATMHGGTLLTIDQDRTPPPPPPAPLPATPNSGIWIDPRCIQTGVSRALWRYTFIVVGIFMFFYIINAVMEGAAESIRAIEAQRAIKYDSPTR